MSRWQSGLPQPLPFFVRVFERPQRPLFPKPGTKAKDGGTIFSGSTMCPVHAAIFRWSFPSGRYFHLLRVTEIFHSDSAVFLLNL